MGEQVRRLKQNGDRTEDREALIRDLNRILDALWKEIDQIKERLDAAGIP